MAGGVVDIPLEGSVVAVLSGQQRAVAPCHFVVGPENHLVEIAVHAVLSEASDGYSPLVLYGPSGTGKSHLARGLASRWKSQHHRDRVVSTTAVDFARELADAIETQAVEEFRAKYRQASLLVLEDLGMLAARKAGKLSAQEELVHTLDAAVARGGWVVVTASAAPSQLPGIMPSLQSRLTAGLLVPLACPGPDARTAILQVLAAQRKVELPASLARQLAEGLVGTVPQLSGALMLLAARQQLQGKKIDERAIRRYLAHREGPREPSLHDIALATARYFTLKLADVRSAGRGRALVTARGVAVYLARRYGQASLGELGSYFGGRDHATVLHSCRQTEALLERDAAIREAVYDLREELWKR